MKAKRVRATLILAGLILAFGLLALPRVSLGALISMNTQNEELGKVLKKLSEASGWDVRLVAGLETPVSVNFKNKTLDEAIGTILQHAGILSHSIVRYADKKEIIIHIFDKGTTDLGPNDKKTASGTQPAGQSEDQGITLREVLISQRAKPETNPLDEVVIPPDEEHPNGITLRELKDTERSKPETDPMDEIVIPPDDDNPNGITLRDVQEAQKNRSEGSLDDVVIPADKDNPNGITLSDVRLADRARTSAGQDMDEIVIPGDDANQPGITLRDVLAAKGAVPSQTDMDQIVIPPDGAAADTTHSVVE
jgi:hypothetical protein